MRFNLSKAALQKLEQAGWRKGRRVDVTPKLALMAQAGAPITPEMIEFLQEFDGLRLTYSNGDCLFDFRTFPHDFTPERCAMRNGLLGEYVVLLGSFRNDNYLVALSESGKVCAYNPEIDFVHQLGQTPAEGLEFILTRGLKAGALD